MRIVFVSPYFYPAWQYGGTPRAAYDLARALAKRGHQLTILTTDSAGAERIRSSDTEGPLVKEFDGLQVRYFSNLSNALAYRHRLFLPIGLRHGIRAAAKTADVVHIHEFRSVLAVRAWRESTALDVPYVLSPHGGLRYLGKLVLKQTFDRIWGRRILEQARAVIVVSDIEGSDAAEFHIKPEQIRFLPNPIATSEFDNLPRRNTFKEKWSVSGEMILFLGRLHWVKGADILLKSFAALNGFSNVKLVIAGPDDGHKHELMRLVAELNVRERVIFTGFLDGQDKRAAIVDARLVVVPSRSEVFSISSVESLLCGTPVIVSASCGLPASLNEKTGVLRFACGDVEDLARVLTSALSDARLSTRPAFARDRIISELSADSIARRAESIYAGL